MANSSTAKSRSALAQTSSARPSLYRKRIAAVTLAALAIVGGLMVGQATFAQELTQTYKRKQAEKGPRALGLIQLSSTGKVRIIPVVIMVDGKFYDASSYKATPVPMALDFGVVYEGFRAGVSQGILTITQPGQLSHNWIAEGTWLPAGAKPPETSKKYAAPVIEEDSKDDRPKLHRRPEGQADADKDESKPAAGTAAPPAPGGSSTSSPSSTSTSSTPTSSTGPAAPNSTSSTPDSSKSDSSKPDSSKSASSAPDSAKTGSSVPGNSIPATSQSSPSASPSKDTKDTSKAASPASRSSDLDQPISDPNRPILRRGKPDPNAHHEPFVDFDTVDTSAKSGSGSTPKDAASPAPVQSFPAISDAGGPDARPYTYEVKPAEEAIYRTKMLELAATLIKLPSSPNPSPTSSTQAKPAASSHAKAPIAKPKPQLEDVKLRIFDLSNSNEPVLVFSARTPLPPAGAPGAQETKEITLVARTNLEGELQKLFFAQTDSHHLDVSPRMELIDAVDADGDGRGELLFRQTYDTGASYAVYRVTADQLYPLYEGTPP